MSLVYQQKKARNLAFVLTFQHNYIGKMPLSKDYLVKQAKLTILDREFLDSLLSITEQKQREINLTISEALRNWKQTQIEPLFNAVLKVAVAEFIYLEPQNFKIAINEAVEFSKQYISNEAAKMGNAVLDYIRLKNQS